MKIMIKTEYIVNSDLWKLFPTIECSRTKDIPDDYIGGIGVPITALDKIGRNDGHSGLMLVDNVVPKIEGKNTYRRLIIRNLKPNLPVEVDLVELLKRSGIVLEMQ